MPEKPPLDIDIEGRVQEQLNTESSEHDWEIGLGDINKPKNVSDIYSYGQLGKDIDWGIYPARTFDFWNPPSGYEVSDKANYLVYQGVLKNENLLEYSPTIGNWTNTSLLGPERGYQPARQTVLDAASALSGALPATAVRAILSEFVDQDSENLLYSIDEPGEAQEVQSWQNVISAVQNDMRLFGPRKPFGVEDAVGDPVQTKPQESPKWDAQTWKYQESWQQQNFRKVQEGPQAGRTINPNTGDVLPYGAIMWGPDNQPYYGENWKGVWKQLTSISKQQREELEIQNIYGFLQASMPVKTGLRAGWIVAMEVLNSLTEGVERKLGAQSLALEHEVSAAEYKTYSQKLAENQGDAPRFDTTLPGMMSQSYNGDYLTPGTVLYREMPENEAASSIEKALRRINPIRQAYNLGQWMRAAFSGKTNLEQYYETVAMYSDVSRMSYSISEFDNANVKEYFDRVEAGENPDLVAQDMQDPIAELAGQMIADPLNLLDIFGGKFAKLLKLKNAKLTMADDLVKAYGKISSESLQTMEHSELINPFVDFIQKKKLGMDSFAGKATFLTRDPIARSAKTYTRVENFGRVILAGAKHPDDASKIYKLMATIGSGDPEKVSLALPELLRMINPDILMSDDAAEFAILAFRTMDDGAGGLKIDRFANRVASFAEDGDLEGLIAHVGNELETGIKAQYPTAKEIKRVEQAIKDGKDISKMPSLNPGAVRFVQEGKELSFMDNLIGTAIDNAWRRASNSFAGRLFIGTRFATPMRGAAFDTLRSSLEMGASINFHSPRVWGDISVGWMGTEMSGLMEGIGKADFLLDNDWAKANTSYQTMESLLDAILNKGRNAKGVGLNKETFDALTNYGGRMMGWFEKKHSQRVIGKGIDDAMKHYIRVGFRNVDDLVNAGLPLGTAKGVRQRLINAYGDADVVLKDILTELNKVDGIDAFADSRWIDDNTLKTLEDINVQRAVSDIIKKDATKDEIKAAVKTLRENVLKNIDNISMNHPVSEQTLRASEGLVEAVDNKLATIDDLSEEGEIVAANSLVKSAIVRAKQYVDRVVNNVFKQINNAYKASGGLSDEAAQMMEEISKVVDSEFPVDIDAAWEVLTDQKRVSMNRFWKDIDTLMNAEDDEIPAIVNAIWGNHGLKGTLPDITISSKDDIKDMLWKVYKAQRKDEFRNARLNMVDTFNTWLEKISSNGAASTYLQQILDSKEIAAVEIAADRANIIEHSVMIDGELKPILPLIRRKIGAGNGEEAMRLLATYMNPHADFTVVNSMSDGYLVQILNRFSDKTFALEKTEDMADDVIAVADASLEDVLQAMNKYRVDQNHPVIEGLNTLLGDNYQTAMPEKGWLPWVYVNQYNQAPTSLNATRRRVLLEFVEDNSDNLELVQEIKTKMNNGDSSFITDLVDESERLISGLTAEVVAGKMSPDMGNVPSIVPAFDEGASGIEYGRHVNERVGAIENAFDELLNGIDTHFGDVDYADLTDEQVAAVTAWFKDAGDKISTMKPSAAKYAQKLRDTILFDYDGDRFGADALFSNFYQFHFWPSRTAYHMTKALPYTAGRINKLVQLRNFLGELHSEMPEWYRYTINSNEVFGTNWDNPLFFDPVGMINPFNGLLTNFDQPEARVNWYSTLYDSMKNFPLGYPNIFLGLAVAAGLSRMAGKGGNDDFTAEDFKTASQLQVGSIFPMADTIKGAASLLGVRSGKGFEPDLLIRALSDEGFFGENVLGPYEYKRAVNAASTLIEKYPDKKEEIMADLHAGEGYWFDEGIRIMRQKDAWGNIVSQFTGMNTRLRSKEDLKIDQFWQDYSALWGQWDSMSPEEARSAMDALHDKHPYAEAMLLGRRGQAGRDDGYTYAVFSRVMPGQLDNAWKAMGLDYEMVSQFYDNKGIPDSWSETDRDKFMSGVLSMAATLAIPKSATQDEWDEASKRYSAMMDEGEKLFGDNIWTLTDGAYMYKEAGVSSQAAWYNYMDMFPTVQEAMDWKAQVILDDPILSAYYGGIDAYRSYYSGKMYSILEDKYTAEIFDKNTIYQNLVQADLDEEAKTYRKKNKDLDKFLKERPSYYDEVDKIVAEFGKTLPEPEPAELRPESGGSTYDERALRAFYKLLEQGNPGYTQEEWKRKLDPYVYNVILNAHEGNEPDADIIQYLQSVASDYGMGYYDFINAVGGAQ